MSLEPLRLNLGCGANKLEGYVNVDVEDSVKPDLVCNFVKEPLPYEEGTVDRIVLFHTIEHISKRHHLSLLLELNRVLIDGGRLIITYPEFLACVEQWRTNAGGKKEFWEATLYGRQLFPSDFHVCIMHTPDFLYTLTECGFGNLSVSTEALEQYNTIVTCVKGKPYTNYETLCLDEMERVVISK